MNKISLKSPGINLILISFAFTAMWILGSVTIIPFLISTLISPNYFNSLTWASFFAYLYFIFIYIFSLLFPFIGLIYLIKYSKDRSSKWYLGIPLLLMTIPLTLIRDYIYMKLLTPEPCLEYIFCPSFFEYKFAFLRSIFEYNFAFLDPMNQGLISKLVIILFPLTTLLFIYSLATPLQVKLRSSKIMALLALISGTVFIFSQVIYGTRPLLNYDISTAFGLTYYISIFIIGLSILVAGIKYEVEVLDVDILNKRS